MKKEIDVYINPGVHPQFKEITDYSPEEVKYYFKEPKGDHNSSFTRKKRKLLTNLHKFGLPRLTKVKNAKKYDLIHSTRGILPLNKKPWIVDVESAAAFCGLSWKALKKPLAQKIIKNFLSSKYCKKIIPQSDAAKRTLLENLDCSKFKHKIETVYLAWHPTKLKRKDSDKVRISFIGRDYYPKGLNDLQKAFEILNKKYPGKLQLKIKCNNIPEGKKLNLPNVKYLKKIEDQREFYNEIFGDCDIYVQPTLIDSYGVTILEAMSTGLPIITTNDFTFPELIEEGKNGFLVEPAFHWYPNYIYDPQGYYKASIVNYHPKTVKDLVDKISILIENPKLRKQMGENSYKMVESGKFSIAERNKKLRRIYDEALSE